MKRYDIYGYDSEMLETADGDWVKYDDHITVTNFLVEALTKIARGKQVSVFEVPLEDYEAMDIAKQALTKYREQSE